MEATLQEFLSKQSTQELYKAVYNELYLQGASEFGAKVGFDLDTNWVNPPRPVVRKPKVLAIVNNTDKEYFYTQKEAQLHYHIKDETLLRRLRDKKTQKLRDGRLVNFYLLKYIES